MHLCYPILWARYPTLQLDQVKNCEVDSNRLPFIQNSGDARVQGDDEELGSEVP